jgi:hypothetical protein
MPLAANFIRAAVRQVTAGAFPTRSQNEWAIYQRDLEITRELAWVHARASMQASTEIRRLETVQICTSAETRIA